MRLAELFEKSAPVWGYWVDAAGREHEVGDSHGHAMTLYALTNREPPLTAEGELDQNRYYHDQKAALQAGWVWMRVAKNEISMMSMKPTRAAKKTALQIMDTYTNHGVSSEITGISQTRNSPIITAIIDRTLLLSRR